MSQDLCVSEWHPPVPPSNNPVHITMPAWHGSAPSQPRCLVTSQSSKRPIMRYGHRYQQPGTLAGDVGVAMHLPTT